MAVSDGGGRLRWQVALLAAVLVAGCTSDGSAEPGDGVEFVFSPRDVDREVDTDDLVISAEVRISNQIFDFLALNPELQLDSSSGYASVENSAGTVYRVAAGLRPVGEESPVRGYVSTWLTLGPPLGGTMTGTDFAASIEEGGATFALLHVDADDEWVQAEFVVADGVERLRGVTDAGEVYESLPYGGWAYFLWPLESGDLTVEAVPALDDAAVLVVERPT